MSLRQTKAWEKAESFIKKHANGLCMFETPASAEFVASIFPVGNTLAMITAVKNAVAKEGAVVEIWLPADTSNRWDALEATLKAVANGGVVRSIREPHVDVMCAGGVTQNVYGSHGIEVKVWDEDEATPGDFDVGEKRTTEVADYAKEYRAAVEKIDKDHKAGLVDRLY